MSKSKGNYYTLGDLVAKGYSPMAVRYALLSGHPAQAAQLHAGFAARRGQRPATPCALRRSADARLGETTPETFAAVLPRCGTT